MHSQITVDGCDVSEHQRMVPCPDALVPEILVIRTVARVNKRVAPPVPFTPALRAAAVVALTWDGYEMFIICST
jgi:hypothetical protein